MELSIQIEGIRKTSIFLEAFPQEASKAILRALKRGTDAANTQANRLIASDIGISVSEVRKRIRKIDPTGATLTGELRGSPKRIPVIDLGARGPDPSRGRGSGVRWRGGSSGRAFIATVRSPRGGQHRGVFERVPGAPSRRRKPPHFSQLPIRELFGPSVGFLMNKHRREIVARGTVAFNNELDRLLDRILGGVNRRLGGGDDAG